MIGGIRETQEMLDFCDAVSNEGFCCRERRAMAACHSFVMEGNERWIGELHFWEGMLSLGAISHETNHAAFCYLRRKYKTESGFAAWVNAAEEEVAQVQQRLFVQCVHRALALYDERKLQLNTDGRER